MSVTPDNYLNFTGILINEVFGSVVLFLLIGLIIITYICVINSVETKFTILINGLFIVITLSLYYNAFILGMLLLVVGFISYGAYNRYFNKQ